MNNVSYMKFNEIEIGTSKQFEASVTTEMIDKFAELSGDFNPLHTSTDFAKKTKFGKRVAHGMLVASFLSRLIGMHLPGKQALYLAQTLNFKKPVFENDKLTVKGTVTGKSESLKLLTIRTVIAKQTGEIVIEGEAKVSYQEE